MKNKTDIQTKNQQIDKILQEQYDAETKILESALLNVAGKTSWDEFPEESEEKIRAGYDRLITRLRETGDFNEAARAEKTGSTRAAKEKLEILEYDWNRTHRILKSAAAAVAVVMLTALVGMTAIADCRYPDKNTQTYQKTSVFEKKLKKFYFFSVIFADLIRIVYVMKVCEAEIRHFILRISVRIKGSEQNVIYLCTDRQRIIKISANF